MTETEQYIASMAHASREELLRTLDAAETDSVRVFDTESMAVGLKQYDEDTAEEKGSRTHTEDELYYVLTGAGTMTVGEERYSVTAGDLLCVEQGQTHDIVEVDESLTVVKTFTE